MRRDDERLADILEAAEKTTIRAVKGRPRSTAARMRDRAGHLTQVIGEAAAGLSEEIKKIAKSKPAERDVPFSAWSLSKLTEFPVAEVPYL